MKFKDWFGEQHGRRERAASLRRKSDDDLMVMLWLGGIAGACWLVYKVLSHFGIL